MSNVDKIISACFIGNYSEQDCKKDPFKLPKLQTEMEEAIRIAVEKGYWYFYCSLQDTFGLLAADTLLSIRDYHSEYQSIRIVGVLPYVDYTMPQQHLQKYEFIPRCINQIIFSSTQATLTCHRDVYNIMARYSNYLITYDDGKDCETTQCIQLAQKNGIQTHTIIRRGLV